MTAAVEHHHKVAVDAVKADRSRQTDHGSCHLARWNRPVRRELRLRESMKIGRCHCGA